MKKRLASLMLAACTSAAMVFTSFAGSWKSDTVGCWYENDDGSYPVNCWQWIDDNGDGIAECFYFDENGYVLINTASPDGYAINSEGEWIVDGVVQTKIVSSTNTTMPSATSYASAAAQTAEQTTTAQTAPAENQSSQAVQSSTNTTSTVWLSATGSKYHRKNNCGRMNPSKARKVSLSDAIALGYEACSKCY